MIGKWEFAPSPLTGEGWNGGDAFHAWLRTGTQSEERVGLTSQMRRTAVSIPSNIAEGAGRNGTREYLYHIGIAHGALAELETQIKLATMLGFTNAETAANELCNCVGKLLTGLHKRWRKA